MSAPAAVQIHTLAAVKQEHEQLCSDVLSNRTTLQWNDERYEGRLAELIEHMRGLSPQVASAADYAWLRETASWWRITFSSTFEAVKQDVVLPVPEKVEPVSTESLVFTREELDRWLGSKAFELSKSRRLNQLLQKTIDELVGMVASSDWEKDADWRNASSQFAYQVLAGDIHLVGQLNEDSFSALEGECWLRQIKEIKAYAIWERKAGSVDSSGAQQNYHEACTFFRDRLREAPKCPPTDFEPIRTYLERRYLRDGKMGWDKPDTVRLLAIKERRMAEAVDRPGSSEQRTRAKKYVAAFYDNIVPAVLKGDEANVRGVLEAFRIGTLPVDSDLAVNCLEMAIAIYFLDPVSLRAALEEGKQLL